MEHIVKKDPAALLMAFAEMIEEFYKSDDCSVQAAPAQTSTGLAQIGREHDASPALAHADVLPIDEGPWENIDIQKKMGINLQVPPEVYRRMKWLTETVPRASLSNIAMAGLIAEVNRLVALHYRPD